MDNASCLVDVQLNVNGIQYNLTVTEEETLIHTLRERLLLLGTKNGCSEGTCGACTVMVDGKARRACLLKTVDLAGAHVCTIEGVACGNKLHPLQEAFIQEGAVGCGFCTPGMVMASLALIEAESMPSESQIRRALQPNLCRCTGYWPIIRAVQRATGQMVDRRFLISSTTEPMRVVGQSVPKVDAIEKVTGKSRFADDLRFPNMVHAFTVRSPHPHARLLGIDSTEALAIPGVVAVVTAQDIPGFNGFGKNISDQPILATDYVSYRGQPVALVVAESQALAQQASTLVQVSYEVLSPVLSPEDAMSSGQADDIFAHVEVQSGDLNRGFAEAAVVVERTFRTQRTDAYFLEPAAGVAKIDENGCIVIYTACQHPYGARQQIAQALAIPENKVRIIMTACGGGFGAKVEASVQVHLGLVAWLLRKPVKMVLTRDESLLTTPKRHPMVMKYRVGANAKGQLTAAEIEILEDTGAFETSGISIAFVASREAMGPYVVPNVQIDGYVCRTNHVPAGAQRGFGIPQVTFGHESVMDELAELLDLSPFEIRERNAFRAGSCLIGGQPLEGSVPALDCLRAVMKGDVPAGNGNCRGSGLALSFKSVGYAGSKENIAQVSLEIDMEGIVKVRSGGLDMGQGSATVLAQITAEELNLDIQQIKVLPADTADELDCGSTEGSRFTLAGGRALLDATHRLRERVLWEAAERLDSDPSELYISFGYVWKQNSDQKISLTELAKSCAEFGNPLKVQGSVHLPKPGRLTEDNCPPISAVDITFCAARAEVEIDPSTGSIDVLSLTLAQDTGRAVNPLNVQVQMEGGAVMGFGYAIIEEMRWLKGGPEGGSLAAYRIPRANQVPQIVSIAVEQPGEVGPYGAKGIGELPTVPIAAAIANAVYDAIGVRVTELPITQEMLQEHK